MKEIVKRQDVQNFSIDWKQYLENFLLSQSGLSQKTVQAYRGGVSRFICFMQEQGIDRPLPDDIHVYIRMLQDKAYKLHTINLYAVSIKKFFKYLSKPYGTVGAASVKIYEDIYSMARPKITRPEKGKHYRNVPTETMVKKLRGYLRFKQDRKSVRDLLMIDLGLYAGLRVNEIANIHCDDIVKDEDVYRLRLLRKGHRSKTESVFVSSDIINRMQAYISKYKIEGHIFMDISHVQQGRSDHLCSGTVSTIITRYIRKLKIKDNITAHSLRHYAGTRFYRETHDIYATQQFLSHRDIETTKVYMHLDKAYEQKRMVLNPI
ncbi:MAG: tyrosine-type recombinase/integrase [Spirochaetes bacterium]|nr:tyrosine-type recombinase/integrase [Spirochaetota bacterium]